MDFNKLKSGLTEVQFDCFPLGLPMKLLPCGSWRIRDFILNVYAASSPCQTCCFQGPTLLPVGYTLARGRVGVHGCIWVTSGWFFSLWARLGGGAWVGVA